MNRNDSPWANPALALALLRPRNAAPKPQQLPPCDTPSCQQAVNKERETEKGKSPCTPFKEKEIKKKYIPIPTPACAREGNAEQSESGSESGSVGIGQSDESGSVSGSQSVGLCQFRESVSGLYKGPIDYGWIYDKAKDPVVVAMLALRIPKITVWNGNVYYNAKILRRLMRQIGGEKPFRDLVHQQWCENNTDGAPRSYAAVFFAKLYAVRDAMRGGVA